MNAREMASAAGLPPMLTYDVGDTCKYTGLSRRTLYEEVRAGRLRALVPKGRTKGYRIKPEDVDIWVRENTRGQV